MGDPEDIVGHKTFRNEAGEHYHEPLRRDEAEQLIAAADAAKAQRAANMPSEQDAINAMCQAHQRLRELGWKEAIYCPKDGSSFDAIEPGSTGIFRTHYQGEWPLGSWWAEDGGDLWPARPCLYRPTEEENRKWAEVASRFRDSGLIPDQSGSEGTDRRTGADLGPGRDQNPFKTPRLQGEGG